MKKTPYQRIMRAAKRGGGCCLSAEDCYLLSIDDAIEKRAFLDDQPEEERQRMDDDKLGLKWRYLP